MTSSILQTATRLLMPLLLLFAVFLLLRGHNQPGGGFVGGLVVAASFVLYSIAFGVGAARRALLVRPATLLGTGLLVAFVLIAAPEVPELYGLEVCLHSSPGSRTRVRARVRLLEAFRLYPSVCLGRTDR